MADLILPTIPRIEICADCKHEFHFQDYQSSHFVDGVCCHCQQKRKYGTFRVLATLRDTRDGFQRTVENEWIKDGRTDDEIIGTIGFMWEEGGNYTCQCNRSAMLYPNDKSKHLDCEGDLIELVDLEILDGEAPRQ